jgi:hypothetical protein
MQFSPISRHLIPLRSKYPPQYNSDLFWHSSILQRRYNELAVRIELLVKGYRSGCRLLYDAPTVRLCRDESSFETNGFPFFAASYDSQEYGRGILTRLHNGEATHVILWPMVSLPAILGVGGPPLTILRNWEYIHYARTRQEKGVICLCVPTQRYTPLKIVTSIFPVIKVYGLVEVNLHYSRLGWKLSASCLATLRLRKSPFQVPVGT